MHRLGPAPPEDPGTAKFSRTSCDLSDLAVRHQLPGSAARCYKYQADSRQPRRGPRQAVLRPRGKVLAPAAPGSPQYGRSQAAKGAAAVAGHGAAAAARAEVRGWRVGCAALATLGPAARAQRHARDAALRLACTPIPLRHTYAVQGDRAAAAHRPYRLSECLRVTCGALPDCTIPAVSGPLSHPPPHNLTPLPTRATPCQPPAARQKGASARPRRQRPADAARRLAVGAAVRARRCQVSSGSEFAFCIPST